MDLPLQHLFLREAERNCCECLAAMNSLERALQSRSTSNVIRSAQEIVYRAADLSKIFWPSGSGPKSSRRRAVQRGEFLRDLLKIKATHVVQNRDLRNHFEHSDERFDAWAEESKNRNIIHYLVGPRTALGGDSIHDGDIIHHYDPATNVYAFRGHAFDLTELTGGVKDLQERIIAALQDAQNKRAAAFQKERQNSPPGNRPSRPMDQQYAAQPNPGLILMPAMLPLLDP